MSCRRVELLLPAAVDERLDPGQRSEVEGHLTRCATCADALAVMRDARAALAACGPAEPPPHLAERISRSVRAAAGADAAPSFWDRFIPIAWPTALAASAAAVVLVALLLRGGDPTTAADESGPTADPVEQVATGDNNTDEQVALNVLGMESH